MARILLIDPCGWQGGVTSDNVFPNIGIAYLTAALRAAGHDVHVADMNNQAMADEDIVRLMRSEQIQIVGISVKTATMGAARRLGTLLKQHLDCTILLGGAHASLAADLLVHEPWVDHVFLGEAEENLPSFCNGPGHGAHQDLGGVWSRGGPPARPAYVRDLDDLPFPDYSLFPQRVKDAVRLIYPLVTSRGCVYDCIYCSVPAISGKRYRKRSPNNILAELKMAADRYGAFEFCIIDDSFNLDMTRAKEFCRLLLQQEMHLRWSCPNGLRADQVDDELADLMFRSGCYSVMLGVESGDAQIFDSICKGETLEDIRRGITIFQNVGIQVGGYFLIGLPGDSMLSQQRSVEFARQQGIVAHFNMLIPYPGTPLWEWVRANGRMLRDSEDGLHFADSAGKVTPVFETDGFSASERKRAYEMVHTRAARFEMLVPKSYSAWKRRLCIMMLVLKYDRMRILRAVRDILRSVTGNKS